MILACRSFSVRHIVIGIAVSFALLFCAAGVAAQASRVGATLKGIVRDTSGAVIPNSKVTLHNSLTNQSRTVTTDEQGFFRAEQLAVGTYEVRVVFCSYAWISWKWLFHPATHADRFKTSFRQRDLHAKCLSRGHTFS